MLIMKSAHLAVSESPAESLKHGQVLGVIVKSENSRDVELEILVQRPGEPASGIGLIGLVSRHADLLDEHADALA